MSTRYQEEEARAAQARIDHVRQFATTLGWSCGTSQTAASLAANKLFVVEYTHTAISSPPRLRDTRSPGQTFLDAIRTTRLSDGQGRRLAVFSSPRSVITAAIEAAETALAKAEESRGLTDGSQLVKDIAELQFKAGQLLDAGKHDELKKAAEQLADMNKHLEIVRTRREDAVRDAQAKLDAAKADRDLLDRAAHRYLLVERAPWLTANSFSNELIAAHERSEIVRAVDACTSIDLTVWSLIDVERAPLPFPIGWLEMLVPIELPDVEEWARARYEALPPKTPARRGILSSEIYRSYLEAHCLHATQLSLDTFGEILSKVFTKNHTSDGNRYHVCVRRTAAQIEAEELAQFTAEKAARERAEFEAWKRARAEASAAESTSNGPAE
jgi:hypothetical protein